MEHNQQDHYFTSNLVIVLTDYYVFAFHAFPMGYTLTEFPFATAPSLDLRSSPRQFQISHTRLLNRLETRAHRLRPRPDPQHSTLPTPSQHFSNQGFSHLQFNIAAVRSTITAVLTWGIFHSMTQGVLDCRDAGAQQFLLVLTASNHCCWLQRELTRISSYPTLAFHSHFSHPHQFIDRPQMEHRTSTYILSV